MVCFTGCFTPLAHLARQWSRTPAQTIAPGASRQQSRLMSIMSAYRSGSMDEKTAAIKRILEKQANVVPRELARSVPPSAAKRNSPPTFEPTSDSSTATASDEAMSDAKQNGLTIVESSLDPQSSEDDPLEGPSRQEVMSQVFNDLAERGRLHRATMQAIESTEEWKGYDAQVTFELMLLRHRYISTDSPMTAARRSQMQAHLRQKQLQIMDEHAERLADEFVKSLTSKERQAFRDEFLRLDASPHVVEAGLPKAPGMTIEQMQAALADITTKMREPAFRKEWDTAIHHITAADLGTGGKSGGGSNGAPPS